MHSDYETIERDNVRRRGEEFDDIGRFLSEQFYSDQTHFVFELLQNAEDALGRRKTSPTATSVSHRVRFELYPNRLEFRHFGREFDLSDVCGVTDILRGTKADDKDQIGKFGIGFKSVYAITASPHIYSGGERFVIDRYIRPKLILTNPTIQKQETLFVFPFNKEDQDTTKAFGEIGQRLQSLTADTLLFLRYIDEIEYSIHMPRTQDISGRYRKRVNRLGSAKQIRIDDGSESAEENSGWLVFEKRVPNDSVPDPIQIAFRLQRSSKSKNLQIVRANPSLIFAYFPTSQDSNLGFLVQGPFHTTPARDNIRNDDLNRLLIAETARLAVESLQHLKSMGILTVSCLEALPITASTFSNRSPYLPIYLAIKQAFSESELLPDHMGGFKRAPDSALASGGSLRTLLTPKQLGTLLGKQNPVFWLNEDISQDRTPRLRSYLMQELAIPEVDGEIFARRLDTDFLQEQSDNWIAQFYAYLRDQKALWRISDGPLRNKAIIRVENGGHLAPFRANGLPAVYLPDDTETSLKTVKRNIASNAAALEFLKDLGLTAPDIVADVISDILPKYLRGEFSDVDQDTYRKHLKRIISALQSDSTNQKLQLTNELKKVHIVLSRNANSGAARYMKASDTYHPIPQLLMYFEGNANAWFVDETLGSEATQLFQSLGTRTSILVKLSQADDHGFVHVDFESGCFRRGVLGFDPNWSIDGLEHALAHPTLEKSAYVWNKLLAEHPESIRGRVQSSEFVDYRFNPAEDMLDSPVGHFAKLSAWLPDHEGSFHKPRDITPEQLHERLLQADRLAYALGMQASDTAQLAKKIGFDEEDLQVMKDLKQHPDEYERLKARLVAIRQSETQFPTSPVQDPDRREERLRIELQTAPVKAYEPRHRSVRTSHPAIDVDTRLRKEYTNQSGQMICQICQTEMPFRKRDGEYYFEAFSAIDDLDIEHNSNYLALCPVCAAKYNEWVRLDTVENNRFRATIMDLPPDTLSVPIVLCGEEAIVRFVESHLRDLQTVLSVRPDAYTRQPFEAEESDSI